MKLIELKTRDSVPAETIVDDSDYSELIQHVWKLDDWGYATNSNGAGMHRLLCQPGYGWVVDHINGNPLDNRRSNLRVCTPRQNSWNRAPSKRAQYGYKGVRVSQGGWFNAVISKDGRRYRLGLFSTPEKAALAYNTAAVELFGECARLNEIRTYGAQA